MANCLIGLGSNLGDRAAHLQNALDQLRTLPQTTFIAQSSFRDTNPAGGPLQASYLNAAARIETSLLPSPLLAELQRIENSLGRVRDERWGPRTIDLDLLLYDRVELETPELTLPHPRMSFRRFVLEPAFEIAAEMVFPINGWPISRLLDLLNTTRCEIGLMPTHSHFCRHAPATRLLKSLETETYVQQVFRRDLEMQEPTSKELSRLNERRKASRSKGVFPQSKTPVRRHPRWRVTDFWHIQMFVEMISGQPEFDELLTLELQQTRPAKLVVVWQPDEAPVLSLLDRARRNHECPPMLWIPKVTLDQARQEVIAAMAAME